MRVSPIFKSSIHCVASPNGQFIATLLSSAITVRSVETLQTVNVIKLPADVSGPVSTFAWSPSSSKLLVAVADQILVLSASDAPFQAVIRNPVAGGTRPSVVQFGAVDTQLLVFSPLGLKLAVFDLSTSKAAEISGPKFHQPSTAARGYCFHPEKGHLALLTRIGGKDTVSIHHPSTLQVQRSWHSDLLDAQGLLWTSDGAWLILWESPAHGRRILLYTPDGQLFRSIEASSLSQKGDADLEPGIRLCQLSADATLCAVCDHSRTVALLDTQTWREAMRLSHPTTITPQETIQVWQEQLDPSARTQLIHPFLRATQAISPPGAQSELKISSDLKSGPSMVAFDASSTLLATKLEDSPGTVWIWDTAAGELRAVLIFHSSINFQWHPCVRELLLIRCLDDNRRDIAYVWDPLSDGPIIISLGEQLAGAKPDGKLQTTWIHSKGEAAQLLLSDTAHFALLSLAADDDQAFGSWQQADESASRGLRLTRAENPSMTAVIQDDTSALDDTFAFKKK